MFSGGGGGYGGDVAGQFAGGGFMPSQSDQGYGAGNQQKKSGDKNSQTLRAVTIRQLVQDTSSADDDNLRVDGVDLHNVTVVGKIVSVQDSNMRINIIISDGTGTAEVSHWLSGNEGDWAASSKKAEWRPGVYIRAYGHVRSFDRKQSIQAFSIRTIHDHNEVTHHFIQAVFQHLHLTKGGAGKGGAPGMGMGQGGAPGFQGPAAGGWQQQGGGGYGGAPGAAAGGPGAGGGMNPGQGGKPCSEFVLDIIRECNSDQGLHVNEISQRLQPQFNRTQVQEALEYLMNEAHIYTTTDDYHYKKA